MSTEHIDLRPGDRMIVEQILSQHVPEPTRVWAFGSRVRGRARRGSDLDLAFDARGPLDPLQRMNLATAFEESMLPFRVDIVDVYELDDTFRSIVEQKAVLIWPHAPNP